MPPIPMPKATMQRTKEPDYSRPKGSIWIEAQRTSLPPEEWVAADGSGLHVTDPTIEGLMAKVGDMSFDEEELTITFIPGGPI